MNSKQAWLRATVALSTLAIVLAGPASALQVSARDLDAPSMVRTAIDAPSWYDGLPSSSVQPGPGSSSSQGVSAGSTTAAGMTGTPVPAGRHDGQQVGTSTGQIEIAPDGQPARSGSLLLPFRSSASSRSRDDANAQARAAVVETVGHGDTVRVEVQSGSM